MKIPKIDGIIDRRILINFTAEPADVEKIIPYPFRPKVYKGKAIVGVCLIRLKNIKPKGFPNWLGLSSENGAHRIAVEWDENGKTHEGVYIPRRDTNSLFNTIIGGRLFPGKHYKAIFRVEESGENYKIHLNSSDKTMIKFSAKEGNVFNKESIFESLENVSDFFEKGSIGYSPNGKTFDGMELKSKQWKVRPLDVQDVESSFFNNEDIFPKGSVQFDNALLMTNIHHEWKNVKQK
jgi:hypothetical protein